MRACPGESVLNALAASDEATAAVRRHVARCTSCRDRIKHMRENDRFLVHAADALAEALRGEAQPQAPSRPMPERDSIPGYRIVEEISRGGQGVVYRAFQADTKRPAAIKMLLAGAFATSRQLHRFERETELAAGLRHPNIVTIFQSGAATDGGRYVAMEFVQGVSLDDYVEDTLGPASGGSKARTDAVMRLMVQVARGVGHAHSAGVIHRDIKPSNILVDEQGVPRVLDFGLARSASAASNAPVTESFAGTPAYAAPERLNEQHARTDARSDVYSMGMMLYRLLTGVSPYPCDGPIAAVARHAAETTPMPPSRAVPRLPKDVQTIVLRCLAKDPQRRYASASALAEDLEDYLVGNPISARRDSATYVLRKLILRNRAASAAVAVVALTVLLAAAGFALLAADLDRARRDAQAALSDSNVQRGRLMAAGGDSDRSEAILWAEAIANDLDTGPSLCIDGTAPQLRSAWSLAEFYALRPRLMRSQTNARCAAVGFDADGTIWAVDDLASRYAWQHDGRPFDPETLFSGQGVSEPMSTFASASGRFCVALAEGKALFQDRQSPEEVASFALVGSPGAHAVVSDDGRVVAILHEPRLGSVLVRDRSDPNHAIRIGEGLRFIALGERAGVPTLLTGNAGPGRRVAMHQPPTWEEIASIPLGPDAHEDLSLPLRCLSLSPDGQLLAATIDKTVHLYDVANAPIRLAVREIDIKEIDRLAFDPSGDSLCVIDRYGVLVRLSLPRLEPLCRIDIGNRAAAMALSPDAGLVAISYETADVAVYDTSDRPWLGRIPSSNATHASIAQALDGTIAWGDDHGSLFVMHAGGHDTVEIANAHAGVITSVAFSPDGAQLLSVGFDGRVIVWDRGGAQVRVVAEDLPRLWSARFSPDGAWIAVGAADGAVRLWPNEAGAPGRTIDIDASRIPMIRFSPDSMRLLCAAVAEHQHVVLLDVATGRETARIDGQHNFIRAVAWSHDGTTIAVAADDRTIRTWDARTGALRSTTSGLPWGAYDLAFHPQGKVLFAAGPGGSVLVIDPQAGVELARLTVHENAIFSIAVTEDGRSLLTSGEDSWIGVTDLHHLLRYIRGNEGYWRSDSSGHRQAPPSE